MNTVVTSILITVVGISACASIDKPIVRSVCLQMANVQAHEQEYVLKRTAIYLREYGFTQTTEQCDVSVKYQAFGGFQGEISAGIIQKGYWSEEGTVNVMYRSAAIFEDEPIVLRGYTTRQELLDSMAWGIVKPVTKGFRSEATSKKWSQ